METEELLFTLGSHRAVAHSLFVTHFVLRVRIIALAATCFALLDLPLASRVADCTRVQQPQHVRT